MGQWFHINKMGSQVFIMIQISCVQRGENSDFYNCSKASHRFPKYQPKNTGGKYTLGAPVRKAACFVTEKSPFPRRGRFIFKPLCQ